MSDRAALVPAALIGFAVAAFAHAESGALGDPTRPTSIDEAPARARSGPAPRWILQSTLVAADRKLAVINGETLRVGEAVNGATVVDIRADGVTLKAGGRKMVFRLLPQVADIRKGQTTRGRE